MEPLITQTLKLNIEDTNCPQMDIDYSLLEKSSKIDLRATVVNYTKEEVDGLKNLTENSRIPFPTFTDSMVDTSSESYYPSSDWRGPSGSAWIGK